MVARLSKPNLFRMLSYVPHPGQVLVHQSKARRRILVAGSRFGKTVLGAHEILYALLEPRTSSLGWVVAPTLDLTDRIFTRVVAALELRFRHRIQDHDERGRRITVRNLGGGISILQAKTADNPVSLLGEGLDYVVLDEAARMDREIWHAHISQRLVDKRGWALMLSTPAGKNWFFRLYRTAQLGRDADFESWSFPSWQNPHLDRTLIEAERSRQSADSFACEYEAQFVGGDEDPCAVCGGPSKTVSGYHIVQRGEVVPACPECKEPVDVEGRTIVRVGRDGCPSLTVLEEVGIDMPPMERPPDPVREPKVYEPSQISPQPIGVRAWPLGCWNRYLEDD